MGLDLLLFVGEPQHHNRIVSKLPTLVERHLIVDDVRIAPSYFNFDDLNCQGAFDQYPAKMNWYEIVAPVRYYGPTYQRGPFEKIRDVVFDALRISPYVIVSDDIMCEAMDAYEWFTVCEMERVANA